MVQIAEKDWSAVKQFKDPVYGYIPVCRAYVKSLIDTQLMQRIKGVAQTGIRPVFSSATHDRFSHSLGVYHFGTKMYQSLADKLNFYVRDTCCPRWKLDKETTDELLTKVEYRLRHWSTLLSIGCILHDIGHPVQSHSFEFLYDDPYLDVEYGEAGAIFLGEGMDEKEWERVYDIFAELSHSMEKTPAGHLSNALLAAFKDEGDQQSRSFRGDLPGKPHERMSAYYIFKDTSLKEAVKALIKASREMAARGAAQDLQTCEEQEISEDLCFIARMIIGWEYPVEEQLKFDERNFFDSLKNCVIHILNGTIDADGIDYLMRNSYAAGYDTSRIDSARLCNAYTAYEKNYVLFPAFSKSALSVLEGYMSARNFEPKWLYSHHKVVYADLLTKQIYKYFTRYWTDRAMLLPSVKRILKHAKDSAIVCGENQDLGKDLLLVSTEEPKRPVHLGTKALLSHMQHWSYPFYTYLLAPCRTYILQAHNLHQVADSDMEAMFHWMACELKQYADPTGSEAVADYECYRKKLKQQVLDGLSDKTLAAISLKDIHILLAESYLETLRSNDTEVRQHLIRWIDSGNYAEVIREVEALGLDSQIFRLANVAGGDKRKLLGHWLDGYQFLLSKRDFEDLNELLEEYQTRCYRSSLWKSQAEYQLFLTDCATELGVSIDYVGRYMEALIDSGMEEHGFSIFDGKVEKHTPALYQEQFYYLPDMPKERRRQAESLVPKRDNMSGTVALRMTGKQIAQKWAKIIFDKTSDYDFSYNRLVVKFYTIKSKRFDKIDLLFGDRAVPLENIFPYHKSDGRFPCFYYNTQANGDPEKILRSFQEKFVKFCREYQESETQSEAVRTDMSHVFRDAVYGDIEMPDSFYDVVCTREFQRLGRIRQLATADRSFPNATHTRLAHSLGTWHVMRLILEHFERLYHSNKRLAFTEKDRNCALLAALLHDLGHGPYSHMIETAFGLDHEKMSRRILMDPDTEIHRKIETRFGADAPERVCRLLDSDIDLEATDGIGLIYRSVISGQLDADRIDYLLRDNVGCGMAFGHIDIQQLIASMRLMPEYSEGDHTERYRLCFNDRYLPAIEQFVYARFQMYRNVYHDPRKQLFEEIYKLLFRRVFELKGAARPDPTLDLLRRINNKEEPTVKEYLCLDDDAVNALIKKWADDEILKDETPELKSQARIIQKLARAFLYQDELFKRVDLGGTPRRYDLLAQRVGSQMGKTCCTFKSLESCAFIYIQGSECAYRPPNETSDDGKNIVLRSMDDGTTSDYAQRSMFRAVQGAAKEGILMMEYCYLFFSEELLKEECVERPEIANVVKQTVESAKPRKHIEIESKFYCTREQLEQATRYLSETYKKVAGVEKEQTDSYYDFDLDGRGWALLEKHFSFRCREKDNGYVFTVKIPTESPNYRSPSQFARHEHEFVSATPDITDEVWEFLLDTLDICGESELREELGRERNQLQKLLTVHNRRKTYRLEGRCEICLDMVDYTNRDQTPLGPQNYQIEIELLGEPESWPELVETVIEPLTKELGVTKGTSRSKLETGISLLQKREAVPDGSLQ